MRNNNHQTLPAARLQSLDALRGLDMFYLVALTGIFRALPEFSDNALNQWLANQSTHPDWQGFTAYDVIFPMFIFIVGVAMPFSFTRRLEEEGGKKELFKHVLIRTLILTLLGVVLWQTPGGAHPQYGFYSVLYRIGFSYFFAAIILMNTGIRGQVYWTFGILIGYWLLMRFVPVPGYGMGDFSREGNLATFMQQWVGDVLSPKFSYVFSLTLITSVSNAMMGVLAGHWLMSAKSGSRKTRGLLMTGIVLILVALISHLDFPINKKLASPSFTLLTCGISAVLLSIFYWIIDVKGYKKWAFFLVVVGVNPITIYVADFLTNFNKIASVFVGAFNFGQANRLVLAITAAVIIWLFLYYLYRQRIFFKI